MNEKAKTILKNVGALVSTIVGPVKTEDMTIESFAKYAEQEVTKAQGEPTERAKPRLLALQKAIEFVTKEWEDTESTSLKVQIYVDPWKDTDNETNKTISVETLVNQSGATTTTFAKAFEEISKAFDSAKEDVAKSAATPATADDTAKAGKPAKPNEDDQGWPRRMTAKEDAGDEVEKAGPWGSDNEKAPKDEPAAAAAT